NCSQRPVVPWLPGGSLMHIDPDWSTSITTLTGNPLGSGGSVQTRPRSERRSSSAFTCVAFFSSDAPLQHDSPKASTRLAGVGNSGDFAFALFAPSIDALKSPRGTGAGSLPAAADQQTESGQGQTGGGRSEGQRGAAAARPATLHLHRQRRGG